MRKVFLLALVGCTGNADDTGQEVDTSGLCVQVVGASGYETLSEAVTAAEAGQSITVCEAVFEETLTVDRDLTITGAGADSTFWIPPLNEQAITVTNGATLTLSGVTFESSRSAIKVEGSTLVFGESTVRSTGNYGVRAIDDSSITIDGVTFEETLWGAVSVKSGALTMTNSTVDGATTFGVKLVGGATGEISNNVFKNIAYTGNGSAEDGWGVWVGPESSGTLTGNTYENIGFGGIRAEDGVSLTVTDETTLGGLIGARIDQTPFTLTNVTFEAPFSFGITVTSVDGGVIDGMEVLTDPDASAQQTAGINAEQGSIGAFLEDSNLTIKNSTLSGNQGFGLVSQRRYVTEVSLDLENVTVDNNARVGLGLYSTQTTLTNVDVTNTRDDNATCEVEPGVFTCNFAILSSSSTIDWIGGGLDANASFGMVGFDSAFTLSDVSLTNQGVVAIAASETAVNLSKATVSDNLRGVQGTSNSYLTVDEVIFDNNAGSETSEYIDSTTGDVSTTIQHYQGIDVLAYDSSAFVSNSTFTNGDRGVFASDGEVAVTDSDFTNYNRNALYHYSPSGQTGSLERVTATDVRSDVVYTIYGKVNLEDVVITNVTEENIHYEFYTNGILDYEVNYTSPGPAIYGNGSTLTMDGVFIDGVDDRGIYTTDSAVTISDTQVNNANRGSYALSTDGAVDISFLTSTPNVFVNDLSIPDVTLGAALIVEGPFSGGGGSVDMTELKIGSGAAPVGGDGIQLRYLDNVSIAGIEIENVSGNGIFLQDVNGSLTGTNAGVSGTVTTAGAHGISASRSTLNVKGLQIFKPTERGINSVDSTVTLTDVTVTDAGTSGFYVDGGTWSVDETVTVTAGEWGMECVNTPTFETCAPSLTGTTGESFGCDGCQ